MSLHAQKQIFRKDRFKNPRINSNRSTTAHCFRIAPQAEKRSERSKKPQAERRQPQPVAYACCQVWIKAEEKPTTEETDWQRPGRVQEPRQDDLFECAHCVYFRLRPSASSTSFRNSDSFWGDNCRDFTIARTTCSADPPKSLWTRSPSAVDAASKREIAAS